MSERTGSRTGPRWWPTCASTRGLPTGPEACRTPRDGTARTAGTNSAGLEHLVCRTSALAVRSWAVRSLGRVLQPNHGTPPTGTAQSLCRESDSDLGCPQADGQGAGAFYRAAGGPVEHRTGPAAPDDGDHVWMSETRRGTAGGCGVGRAGTSRPDNGTDAVAPSGGGPSQPNLRCRLASVDNLHLMAFPGGMRIGPYSVLETIEAGGFGTTMLAVDAAGSRVAVKVLHAHPGCRLEAAFRPGGEGRPAAQIPVLREAAGLRPRCTPAMDRVLLHRGTRPARGPRRRPAQPSACPCDGFS
jgi:hypothetical protein